MTNQMQRNNTFFRQLLFLIVLAAIGVLLVKHLSFFMGAFLGAITLYVVFRRTFFLLVDSRGWKPWVASVTLVATSALILVGLLFGVFELVAKQLQNIDTSRMVKGFNLAVEKVNGMFSLKIIPEDILTRESGFIAKAGVAIVNSTYSFAINILLTLLILYFMLTKAHKLEAKINRYSPLQGDNKRMVSDEITGIIYSNAVGIPLTMLVQGTVAALLYWAFGIHNIAFWAFITALCGLIPFVGTMLILVPLGVSFIANGFMIKGLLLIVVGGLIISNVDNLFRIFLNKRISNTHPLIVIFGIIMGIPLFGFWGIIFGPLLISVFLLLIRIYYAEFRLISKSDMIGDSIEDDPTMV